jgi:hypothetical protein
VGDGAGNYSAYAGTSCTNQFPRSLNASGAATCASVANTDLAGSIAASKLVGTDIATVGTITAGTWQGTAINVAYGGARFRIHGRTNNTIQSTYFSVPCINEDSTEENLDNCSLLPTALTCRNLLVTLNTAPGAGKSWTVTLRSGTPGSMNDTALTCAVMDTATTCNDTTQTASIPAGNVVIWSVTASGTPTAAGNGSIVAECYF